MREPARLTKCMLAIIMIFVNGMHTGGGVRVLGRPALLIPMLVLIAGVLYGLRFFHLSPFAASWDEVDFVLALERYDLLAMQPHFPGYPYFILAGEGAMTAVDHPVMALSLVSAWAGLWSLLLLRWIASFYLNAVWSWLLVLAVAALSSLWVVQAGPMSESMGIATVLFLLACSLQSAKYLQQDGVRPLRRGLCWWLTALFASGLVLGTRLSYAPFCVSLLVPWWLLMRRSGLWAKGLYTSLSLALWVSFQGVWLAALAHTEGGMANFLQLALGFTSGHFAEWGGTYALASSLFHRLFLFFGRNLLFAGLAGGEWLTFGFLFAWIALAAVVLGRGIRSVSVDWQHLSASWWMLFLSVGAYAAWAFFAQNVDKPRHVLVLLPFLLLLLFRLLQSAFKQGGRALRGAMILLLGLWLVGNGVSGYALAREQAGVPPPTYQLARYLEQLPDPERAVVFSWEEDRVLGYLEVPVAHKRVFTYSLFLADANQRLLHGQRIWLTNAVAEGFRQQGIEGLERHLRSVATFHGDPRIHPVYHSITLYEWTR